MSTDKKIKEGLRPLAWLYGLGVWFRNKLFDWKMISSEEFKIPVISIGNLIVGGTGKTPHTEYILQVLSKRYKVAVLSRGYKRKTKGFVLADKKATARTIGDESYQIYRKYPEVLVAVDEKRRHGIHKLLSLDESLRPQVILLDDAFQHRHVSPSLSILLTEASRLYHEDMLLPAGRLREHKFGADRANVVIVTKSPDTLQPIDYRIIEKQLNLFPYQELYFTSYKYRSLLPVFPETTNIKKESMERVGKEKFAILLVTGIADPTLIIEYVKPYARDFKDLNYSDHHIFSRKDIETIAQAFDRLEGPNKIIITTEKDAARLSDNNYIPKEIKPYLFYLPIEVAFQLDKEEKFKQKIYEHISKFKRDNILA